jgi:hypothetical protein
MRAPYKVLLAGCAAMFLVSCSSQPIVVPQYAWPESFEGEIAMLSLVHSADFARDAYRYKQEVRERSTTYQLVDTFSIGIGWSFSQEELVPSVHMNLLKLFETEDNTGLLEVGILNAQQEHLLRVHRLIDNLKIAQMRRAHYEQRLKEGLADEDSRSIVLAQNEMSLKEAEIRLEAKWEELVFYTGLPQATLLMLAAQYPGEL